MSNGKTFSTHPLAHGASTTEKIAHVVDVKNDKDADGKPRFRAKCRIEGDQRDEAAIPDENLQWFRVEMPVNSFGSSPYLKPGMKVRIKDHGGSPGSTGISPYISSIVSYQPTNPEDGQSSGATLKRKKGVGPRVQQPPPREDFPQWMGQPPWPTEATKTRESRRAGKGDTYVPGQSQNAAKAPHEAPNKNRHEETGTPSKAGGALTDDDTMGSQKRQDNPDFQTQIKSLIGNQGAYVPQALDMIMQMKKVTGMQNPKAIQAVGAGNLAGAIKALQGLFPKKKSNGKDEPKNNKCALENRPNLTPEELAECEELDKLSGLAADEAEGASDTALYPPVEPEYETYTANSWNDQHANTIDTPSYQAGIANVASYLMANADFIANVSTAVDSGVVANGITGNTAQSNQVASATYNPTVALIAANSTTANTLANGVYTQVVTLIVGDSVMVNTMANTFVNAITANTTQVSYIATAARGNTATLLLANSNFLANVMGNSQVNVYVSNTKTFSGNVVIIRKENTPASSGAGGETNKSIFFDNNYIYCVLANGEIRRALLSTF